jgi:hypothetical protein
LPGLSVLERFLPSTSVRLGGGLSVFRPRYGRSFPRARLPAALLPRSTPAA